MTADGPLANVRILDLTHVWAGPLAVRYLADLGADVVRVEAPGGRGPQVFPYAPLGGWLGGAPGDDPWNNNAIFVKLMRNRRSLCIDLKEDAGRELFLALVASADVLMENFSALALARLGLGYEVLKAHNPRLIYVAMPGFGNSGPLSERVAFGPTVEAMSGLTDVLGYAEDEPKNTAMALMDPISGAHSFAVVTQALLQREQTGRGCQVEMSLHEGGVNYSGPWLIERQLGHAVATWGNRHPQMVPHGIFPCQGDDQWIAIACAEQRHWRGLLAFLADQGVDMPTSWTAEMDLHARRAVEGQIEGLLTSLTRQFDKHSVAEALQAAGVPAGAVNTTPDMVSDAQTRARGFFVDYERHATPMPGNPLKMTARDPASWTPCPALGAHNDEVLADWLGYDEPAIANAKQSGVLHDKPPS